MQEAWRHLSVDATQVDAFFGRQAGHEVVVGLAVLAAITARTHLRQETLDFGGYPPVRVGAVGRKDFLDDFKDGLVLKHPAAALLSDQSKPGNNRQAISGKTTVGT